MASGQRKWSVCQIKDYRSGYIQNSALEFTYKAKEIYLIQGGPSLREGRIFSYLLIVVWNYYSDTYFGGFFFSFRSL